MFYKKVNTSVVMADSLVIDLLVGLISGGMAKTAAAPLEALKTEAQLVGAGASFEPLPGDVNSLLSRLTVPTFLNIARCVQHLPLINCQCVTDHIIQLCNEALERPISSLQSSNRVFEVFPHQYCLRWVKLLFADYHWYSTWRSIHVVCVPP
jgi:hypothetical protein